MSSSDSAPAVWMVCPTCGTSWPGGTEDCPADGAKLVASKQHVERYDDEPLPAGTMVGEYQVESLLGAGGMGEVYAARHPMIGKQVAIKVMNRACSANPLNVDRFVTEAKAVNAIGHANIVDIFSFGKMRDGRCFFVMEKLRGESLRSRLDKGPISLAQAVDVVEPVLRALEAAHAQNIIHRDLKPDNIFLVAARDGEPEKVKLLDFGIAKLSGGGGPGGVAAPSKTDTGTVVGTPSYMAPEQAAGSGVEAASDTYSLGVVFFEMATGQLPFRAASTVQIMAMHVCDEAPAPSTLRPVPADVDRLILAMLRKRPQDRPSPREIKDVMAGIRKQAQAMLEAPTLRGGDLEAAAARAVLVAAEAAATPPPKPFAADVPGVTAATAPALPATPGGASAAVAAPAASGGASVVAPSASGAGVAGPAALAETAARAKLALEPTSATPTTPLPGSAPRPSAAMTTPHAPVAAAPTAPILELELRSGDVPKRELASDGRTSDEQASDGRPKLLAPLPRARVALPEATGVVAPVVRSRRKVFVFGALALAAIGGVIAWQLLRSPAHEPVTQPESHGFPVDYFPPAASTTPSPPPTTPSIPEPMTAPKATAGTVVFDVTPPGATIEIAKTTFTLTDGHLAQPLAAGHYPIAISHHGYDTHRAEIEVAADKATHVTVALVKHYPAGVKVHVDLPVIKKPVDVDSAPDPFADPGKQGKPK